MSTKYVRIHKTKVTLLYVPDAFIMVPLSLLTFEFMI
jgi:hypothetical protein